MMSMDTSSCRNATPHLPSAMAMRPQLQSCPATAVLTSGELATERAAASASASLGAPVTLTVMRREAPSPSAATARASPSHTTRTA